MKFWFTLLSLLMALYLMTATAFGNQSSEERYQQIVEDFVNGSIPQIEFSFLRVFKIGRCVYQEKPNKLHSAFLEITKEENGPYYGAMYRVNLYLSHSRFADHFDNYGRSVFLNIISQNNQNNIISTHAIPDSHQSMRSFEELLLVSIEGGMCYFFKEAPKLN